MAVASGFYVYGTDVGTTHRFAWRTGSAVDVAQDVREDEDRLAKINWTLQQFNIDELTDYYKNPRFGGCVG